MCGIAGIIDPGRRVVDLEHALNGMTDVLVHRGPDDAGRWLSADHRVALGHRRLSILDLSPTGHQPMVSPCGRYVIVFNGEVYNYLEVRAQLESEGLSFAGQSDTEVVLGAYRRWGAACVDRFNGMFAFAIWDAGTDGTAPRLFIARDRAGKKPFYYIHDRSVFKFASELKALGSGWNLSVRALNFYLALGYVPGDLCIANGVKKLPPAHAGFYEMVNGELRLWRYWNLPDSEPDTSRTLDSLADEAESLLEDAVRLRLRSDVPVGVLLSGGIDSSLITAVATRAGGQRLKTFTVTFPKSEGADEGPHARLVADYFGTDHLEITVEQDFTALVSKLYNELDEPLADSSLLPTYVVSRETRRHVKVALGGDGGDELFGGYGSYDRVLRMDNMLKKIPVVPGLVAKLAKHLPIQTRGRKLVSSMYGGAVEHFVGYSSLFDPVARSRLLAPDLLNELGGFLGEPEAYRIKLVEESSGALVERCMRADFQSYLPDDVLMKVDRASMAVSLEVRAPFLDKTLVEFAMKCLPQSMKVTSQGRKVLLRHLAHRLLPKSLDIARKQGFSLPADIWLSYRWRRFATEVLEMAPNSIYNRSEIRRLLSSARKNSIAAGYTFPLVALELWRQRFGGTE